VRGTAFAFAPQESHQIAGLDTYGVKLVDFIACHKVRVETLEVGIVGLVVPVLRCPPNCRKGGRIHAV
jgi:hypothetical protein